MVIDTQQWIWLVIGDVRLHPVIRDPAQRPVELIISAITIWEVLMLIQKGRLKTAADAAATLASWRSLYPIRVQSINEEIAGLSRTLAFNNEDPADRFIAATAYHLGTPLVTTDEKLRSLPWLKTP